MLLEEKDGLSRALIQSAGGRPDEADKAAELIEIGMKMHEEAKAKGEKTL